MLLESHLEEGRCKVVVPIRSQMCFSVLFLQFEHRKVILNTDGVRNRRAASFVC